MREPPRDDAADHEAPRPAGGPTPVRAVFGGVVEEPPAPAAPESARPREEPPSPPAAPEQRFSAEGVEWIARLSGEAMAGTGRTGRAHIVTIRFFRADAPEVPLREVITGAGRFEALYDEELRDLLARAKDIVEGGEL